jgi:hypothetical protein
VEDFHPVPGFARLEDFITAIHPSACKSHVSEPFETTIIGKSRRTTDFTTLQQAVKGRATAGFQIGLVEHEPFLPGLPVTGKLLHLPERLPLSKRAGLRHGKA